MSASASVQDVLRRNLIFVSGKGGVGKTVVSQAIALTLARRGKRTLWVTFEDPTKPPGELVQVAPNLWHLNCEAGTAFEEYMGLKIGVPTLTRIFLQNKLMRYLAKAAPGIHELVLLGKVWHDREKYDHVVCDMPSTGYGLAMFQSTENFAKLFKGGPIHRDAEAMLLTFRDSKRSGQLVVSLPEEMPLREGLELRDFLLKMFPDNPAAFLVNRMFPRVSPSSDADTRASTQPDQWPSPVPASAWDYIVKRGALEAMNLDTWSDEKIDFTRIPYIQPPLDNARGAVSEGIAKELGDLK